MQKIFDRSIDLAQFDETSALYSVARSWIQGPRKSRADDSDVTTPSHDTSMMRGVRQTFNYFVKSYESSINRGLYVLQDGALGEHYELPLPISDDTTVRMPSPVRDLNAAALDINAVSC